MKKNIYFMRPVGHLGPIKIGCTAFPQARLEQLATWSPFPLEIIHFEEAEHSLERNLHRCFADYHSHHEWFHPGERLLEAISKIRAGAKISDAVDLTDNRGSIFPGRKQIVPELVGCRSYTMKVMWALKRARNASKVMLYAPDDVDRIMHRWSGECGYHVRRPPIRPTDDELAIVQRFIDDPHPYCLTNDQKYPKEIRQKRRAA